MHVLNTIGDLGCLPSEHQASAMSKKRNSDLVSGMLAHKNSNQRQYTREHAGKWLSNYKMSLQSGG